MQKKPQLKPLFVVPGLNEHKQAFKKNFWYRKTNVMLKIWKCFFFLIDTQIWHLMTADEHKSEVILDLTLIIFDLVGQVI